LQWYPFWREEWNIKLGRGYFQNKPLFFPNAIFTDDLARLIQMKSIVLGQSFT